ncbi:MAG: hypothetical protein LBQ15_04845 [Clostridium sp.]|jgi:hypothetical protein|nr:hypothetical protein [Clostridium sp.]
MFPYIDDSRYKHLLCIITKGVEDGERLSGLAHVGEHACLLPCFERTPGGEESYFASGYTCIDHACLYYAAKRIECLSRIQKKINDKSILRKDRVDIAKHQVINECENLKYKIKTNETIVKFVTGGRIQNFAAGKSEDIRHITYEDVYWWLEDIQMSHNAFFFFLESPEPTFIKKAIEQKRNFVWEDSQEKRLYIDGQQENKVAIYIKIPCTKDKIEYFRRKIEENYLQYCLNLSIKEKIEVYEKYFTYSERYLVIEMVHGKKKYLERYIIALQDFILNYDSENYIAFKAQFYETQKKLFKDYRKRNSEVLAELQNQILYHLPILDIPKDLELLSGDENDLSNDLIKSLRSPLRIVVFCPEDEKFGTSIMEK